MAYGKDCCNFLLKEVLIEESKEGTRPIRVGEGCVEYEAGGTEAMPRKGLTWIRLAIYMNPSVRWGNGGPQKRGFLGSQWQVEQEPSSPPPILPGLKTVHLEELFLLRIAQPWGQGNKPSAVGDQVPEEFSGTHSSLSSGSLTLLNEPGKPPSDCSP